MTLTELEKKVLDVELEQSRLNREKSMLVLHKSLFIYFCFLFVGIIGFINGFLSKNWLNALIIAGLVALIIGTVPYIQNMRKEERKLNRLLEELRRKP